MEKNYPSEFEDLIREDEEIFDESHIDAYVKTYGIRNPLKDRRLRKKEIAVLEALSVGMTLSQAADHMGIPYESAKQHLKTAVFRTKAKTRAHAIALAMRRGYFK